MNLIRLNNISPLPPEGMKKKECKKVLRDLADEIGELQYSLYKERKKAMLIIFQGMDASGKDGSTRKVFCSCSPSGIYAHGFKKPTDKELMHDFLWRVHPLAPAKGQIAIFNRSHYEDIVIQRVHKWIDEKRVQDRIDAINAWEKMLTEDNNTIILKFYLHLSQDRQKEKLQERIDDPSKNWKHNPRDWEEAKLWDEYMHCYEEAINECNHVPWYIVPADKRWYRNYFVANKVLEVMRNLTFDIPVLPEHQKI